MFQIERHQAQRLLNAANGLRIQVDMTRRESVPVESTSERLINAIQAIC